ncbi:MAG: Gfo/Idh/MocA family oxidoreductase [Clostridia bacterium]|nr:Gfo/Idh/MocA family oxidoreductase [Clostridia bacterium]
MNIAFAGFRHGHILSLYFKAIDSDEVSIKGCFEENDKEREKMADAYKIDFNYQTYEEILSDDSIDIVAIGDYFAKRGKMSIEALKRGKHVICDKPICTSLDELSEIEKLSAEKNLKVGCMLDLRYMAQTEKVKELILQGEIGEIVNIAFTGQHCLDYGNRAAWYFEEGKHGGTINDIAIHGVDLVRYLTGKDFTKVNCAKAWNAFATKEPDFKDCGQFMAEMEDISVMADVSYAAPKCNKTLPTYWDFYLWGKNGMINFKCAEKVIHLYNNGEEKIIECEGGVSKYLDDFVAEIKGDGKCFDTTETLKSQRQVLMIQQEADKC